MHLTLPLAGLASPADAPLDDKTDPNPNPNPNQGSQASQMLRSMMDAINGSQKLRVLDEGLNEIVDENKEVIDINYVRREIEVQRERLP